MVHYTKAARTSTISDRIKKDLYNFILQYPQTVKSSSANYCLQVSVDSHSEPQLVTKFVLQVSVRELDNIMFCPP